MHRPATDPDRTSPSEVPLQYIPHPLTHSWIVIMPEKGNDSLLASRMGWVKSNRNSRTLRKKKLKKKKKEVQARGILYRGGGLWRRNFCHLLSQPGDDSFNYRKSTLPKEPSHTQNVLLERLKILNHLESAKMKVLVAQSCPTLLQRHKLYPTRLLCPWDSPGKNIGGVAISFSRGSLWPRNHTQVSCIAARFFTVWATREALLERLETLNHLKAL